MWYWKWSVLALVLGLGLRLFQAFQLKFIMKTIVGMQKLCMLNAWNHTAFISWGGEVSECIIVCQHLVTWNQPSTMCVAHACSYMFSSPCGYWEVVLFVPYAKQYTWSSNCEICILLPYNPPHISGAVREQFLAWPRVHKNRRLE